MLSLKQKNWSRWKRIEKGRGTFVPGRSMRYALFTSYLKNALDRGLKFELTQENFAALSQGNCHYCGSEPRQKFQTSDAATPYTYNGIDRVDNSRGYHVDNCVPCCKICNKMKSALSEQEFKEHVAKIFRHGA